MTDNTRLGAASSFAAVMMMILLSNPAVSSGKENNRKTPWFEQESVQQKLDLTDDQVVAITEVEQQYLPRLAAMTQEKRIAYRTMMTSLDTGELPEAEFTAKRARLETAYGSHAALTAERWQALRNVLTEAQWRNLPEAAPKALVLGNVGVAKRGGLYMGPGGRPGAPPKTSGK